MTDHDELETQKQDHQFLNDRLRQRWASKARRRSSDLKNFVSDRLNLQENPKIALMISKNGQLIIIIIIILENFFFR